MKTDNEHLSVLLTLLGQTHSPSCNCKYDFYMLTFLRSLCTHGKDSDEYSPGRKYEISILGINN